MLQAVQRKRGESIAARIAATRLFGEQQLTRFALRRRSYCCGGVITGGGSNSGSRLDSSTCSCPVVAGFGSAGAGPIAASVVPGGGERTPRLSGAGEHLICQPPPRPR